MKLDWLVFLIPVGVIAAIFHEHAVYFTPSRFSEPSERSIPAPAGPFQGYPGGFMPQPNSLPL